MKIYYKLNEEENDYKIIDKNYFFLHNLLPNNINIFPLLKLDEKVFKYTENIFKEFFFLIYPVYKYRWRDIVLTNQTINNTIHINCSEKNKNLKKKEHFYNHEEDINLKKYFFDNKLFFYDFKIYTLDEKYCLSLESYAFLYLYFFSKIDVNNINHNFVLGVLEACTKLGIGSLPFSQNYTDIENKFNFKFSKISLKSMYVTNQIIIFDCWKNKYDVILTGGTGTGKTSQIPKLFWWINFLYDGFEDLLDFNKFEFNLMYLKNYKILSRRTILSLPRKILINENSLNIARSLGYKEINNSVITCKYKDVKETNFHNEHINKVLTPFFFYVNRSTKINEKVNTLIFDEIHEHDTYCDIGITIAKHYKEKYNIRNLILITATIVDDLENLKKFIPDIKEVHIKGKRLFPIEEHDYSHVCNQKNNFLNLHKIIKKYSIEKSKSTLIFFPTLFYIENMEKTLKEQLDKNFYVILQLHRNSLLDPNVNIIEKIQSYKKKHVIILSTPIAESSLTIPNVKVVIDTGLFYCKTFFSGKTLPITQSMMEQRKGRTGRVSSGTYINLFDKKKINFNFKKIDHEFLIPYIINCLYFKIDFNDIFIIPSDMNRFDKTIKYFKNKKLDIEKHINKIYKIYNSFNVSIPEYLIVYCIGKNKEKEILNDFESITLVDDQIKFIKKNDFVFKNISKLMNIECVIVKTFPKKDTILPLNIINIINYYEDDNNSLCVEFKKLLNSKKKYLISENIIVS